MKKKVLVAMSGGVDSSVAVVMMLEAGYEVAGMTMVMDETIGDYNQSAAVRDARKVASHLGIMHFVEDTSLLFNRHVVDDFVNCYTKGKTPNPCVQCNRFVKFGRLLERAIGLGYDYLVTGHYAKLENGILRRGSDPRKDQSYFLYPIYSVDTNRILFPLGSFEKSEIREIALKNTLPVAQKEESQDICFISGDDYGTFLRAKGLKATPGAIVDVNGKKLGTHQGIWNYTIGQRKGLGALGQRMFVKEIVPQTNIVIVATDSELCTTGVTVNDMIVGKNALDDKETVLVQVRYRSTPSPATVVGRNGSEIRLEFKEPVRAVAPGQSAVFYGGDAVLGGGVII